MTRSRSCIIISRESLGSAGNAADWKLKSSERRLWWSMKLDGELDRLRGLVDLVDLVRSPLSSITDAHEALDELDFDYKAENQATSP